MNILGPALAIGLGIAEVAAVWRWGFTGCIERTGWLVHRIAHGPTREPSRRPDYAEIERLEREVFGAPTREGRADDPGSR